jgi:major type 1 subunit fimbrin (pilin)
MNKTFLSAALATVCGIAALAPQATMAADGTLTFRGNISATTCTITGGTNTNGGTSDIIVTLPTVSANALASAGATAGDTPFTLSLSGTGCTEGKLATVHFEPTSSPLVNASTGNLANNGSATNVEVGLLNKNQQPINLFTSANSLGETIATGSQTATIPFIARYVATGVAGEGTVDTSVEYSLTYN